ncbi:hypothetical protein GPECTOR_73g646 [Gonium pectorale]|uniref:Ankyrin repeat domain-containing protein n=1 Tax=Gonium pectorale TaxID=33097 RepID=A0A150G3N4_GONPE|nr:hypothetical protein GPECTOR_73g646 [Gonium pectorale]|eukprot:KXZ44125.1 hypothetical protein GPECTOR_73g646 [Gonium pectorale]
MFYNKAHLGQVAKTGATRGLTLKQRHQLLSLTAASGVVANLGVAEQAAGCVLTYQVFEAAAATGKLESCQWLRGRGCPMEECEGSGCGLLGAAAAGGHRHVCEWLLGLGLVWSSDGLAEAARGGHVGLMEWLQERRPHMRLIEKTAAEPDAQLLLLEGAAHGCDLATLQRLWRASGALRSREEGCGGPTLAAAAAGSPTPDWAAKVKWLEAQGCPRGSAAQAAAACPDAPARLAWLRGRGFPVNESTVVAAARSGNVAAVQYLLAEVGVAPAGRSTAPAYAAQGGHLAALQALHAAGWGVGASHTSRTAAARGHLHVLAWLVGTFGGEAVVLDAELLARAARSGSVELLAWLLERGCPWDGGAYKSAAESGCEAALEWLAARGCPMPFDRSPYAAACANGDLAAVRCLRRLGVPWGFGWGVLSASAVFEAPEPVLRLLLGEDDPARR